MIEPSKDCRAATRYPAVNPTVYLGWWEEPEFRTCLASLKNVSQGGALVHVAMWPPEGSRTWLCVGGKPPSEWAEVAPVSIEHPHEGLFRVHLRFVDMCPYEVFKKAVHGIENGAA
jgi:hypothetical protein